MGHLLWSGIVDDARASGVVRRLLGDDLFTGWGIRTMSSGDAGYNPLAYHTGTVWPHDTAIVAAGMRRYGSHEAAAVLCRSLLEAAHAFGAQLPELFAGFARDRADLPVEYPQALKPQSWAAGAPLLCLRTLLGLEATDGQLHSAPQLPEGFGRISLRGIRVRGRSSDIHAQE
jgi:glycogen debranching enzyme